MSWTTKNINVAKLLRVKGDLVVDPDVIFTPVIPAPAPRTSIVRIPPPPVYEFFAVFTQPTQTNGRPYTLYEVLLDGKNIEKDQISFELYDKNGQHILTNDGNYPTWQAKQNAPNFSATDDEGARTTISTPISERGTWTHNNGTILIPPVAMFPKHGDKMFTITAHVEEFRLLFPDPENSNHWFLFRVAKDGKEIYNNYPGPWAGTSGGLGYHTFSE